MVSPPSSPLGHIGTHPYSDVSIRLMHAGPVSSEIWDKGVKSTAAGEAGSGNWDIYSGTQYGAAMEATRKFLLQDMESKSFFLPCEDVAKKCWEV